METKKPKKKKEKKALMLSVFSADSHAVSLDLSPPSFSAFILQASPDFLSEVSDCQFIQGTYHICKN